MIPIQPGYGGHYQQDNDNNYQRNSGMRGITSKKITRMKITTRVQTMANREVIASRISMILKEAAHHGVEEEVRQQLCQQSSTTRTSSNSNMRL